MEKIKMIMLVDDNYADNDYHRYVIEELDPTTEVKIIDDSRDALEYFTNCFDPSGDVQSPTPNLVFLDINMPAMNGFELLDKIRELPDAKEHKKAIKIFMLTGSLNPDDYQRATEQYADLVAGYRIKPLTPEMLQEIEEKYF